MVTVRDWSDRCSVVGWCGLKTTVAAERLVRIIAAVRAAQHERVGVVFASAGCKKIRARASGSSALLSYAFKTIDRSSERGD